MNKKEITASQIRKIFSLLLTFAIGLLLCACGSNELPSSEPSVPTEEITPSSIIKNAELQYPTSNELFKYNVYDTYVEITEYIGAEEAEEVVVPSQLENLPVYVVKRDALDNCHANTIIFEDGIYQINCNISHSVHVVLPSTLSSVSWGTFERAYNLETVVIPDGIASIGSNAFRHCMALKEVTIPSTVTSLGSEAFAFCTSLETVNLSEGLRTIDRNAFSSCKSLKTIQIPSTVQSIKADAFMSSGLETLEIPENVQTIGSGLFTACTDLKTLTVYNANLEIEAEDGFDFSSLFSQCNPELVVHGKAGSTIAKQCAEENIFFEVIE